MTTSIPPARFIWGDRRELVHLRRTFTARAPTRILLRLSADTGYELFLDGRLVARVDEWCNARDYDLTRFLAAGPRHVLAVKGINHGGHKGVACQMVLGEGRQRMVIGSDQAWRCCSEERWGWTLPGFDDRAWPAAHLVAVERCGAVPWAGLPGDDPARLIPVQQGSVFFQGELPKLGVAVFPAPPVVKPTAAVLRVVGEGYRDTLAAFPAALTEGARVVRCAPGTGTASHHDGSLTVTAPGEWGGAVAVLDFAAEVAGFLRLRLTARGPAVLRLRYGESLGECLDARPPWRLLERMVSEEVEVLSGVHEWESRTRQGFRYVRIEVAGCPEPLVISGFGVRRSLYPVAFAGHFACSDPGLERIWRVGRDTLHQCMQEHYLDGIRRDRFLWVGDARLEALINDYAFGDAALFQADWSALAAVQYADGAIPALLGEGASVIWDYVAWWLVAVHEHHLHHGDRAFLERMLPPCAAAVRWLVERADPQDGLIEVPPRNSTGWLFVLTLRAGKDPYMNRAYQRALGAAIALLEGAAGQARLCRRLRAALALLTSSLERLGPSDPGRAPANMGSSALEGVGIIEELFAQQRPDDALAFIRDHWQPMLDKGATTFWESIIDHGKLPAIDQAVDRYEVTSRCHGWSAGPTYALPAFVTGVRALEPGWRSILVQPQLGSLAWARAVVPTPAGPLAVAVERQGAGLRCTLQVPRGCQARVELPAVAGLEVRCNGRRARPAGASDATRCGPGLWVVESAPPAP